MVHICSKKCGSVQKFKKLRLSIYIMKVSSDFFLYIYRLIYKSTFKISTFFFVIQDLVTSCKHKKRLTGPGHFTHKLQLQTENNKSNDWNI